LNFYALSKKHFTEWGQQFSAMGKIKFITIKLEHIYGSGDDDNKFTTYIIKSCLENIPELKLTHGEQKRDFIFIDDAISAYLILLQKIQQQAQLDEEYDLGSGSAISIREFVETVHRITNSKTMLNFGALPYRDHEIMESHANTEPLKALGWLNKTSLSEGIESIIKKERKR
jgi:nucleoside-diphosphate-sugar epimerase